MVERTLERRRAPEPAETIYDRMRRLDSDNIRRRGEGKVVVKGSQLTWEQNRQGLVKFYSYDTIWNTLAAPGWRIFMNLIKKHGGKHVHQGGLAIYVVDGKGYSVVDGVKYPWEEGDLLILPVKPKGCEHQHFNELPDKPAIWLAFIFTPMRDPALEEPLQREDHPDWMGPKTSSP